MDTLKELAIYTLKELLMYIKKRTCKVYKHNELVMYIIKYFLFSIYSTKTT